MKREKKMMSGFGCDKRERLIRDGYDILSCAYGPQFWWPAKTPFEVIVGAILTQNTNWLNVEKAIANLRQARVLSPNRMREMSLPGLARLIRPSGYFNAKALKIKNFLDYFYQIYKGRISCMKECSLEALRCELLGINGIGPETADSILLYALEKPVFVVDAYTKRIFSTHGVIDPSAGYADIQRMFMCALKADVAVYNEYHALIVRCAKAHYRRGQDFSQSPLSLKWSRLAAKGK